MDVSTIDVNQKTAAKHFASYRAAVRDRHSAEDEQIMRCYRALAKGQKLINAADAIVAAGVNDNGLPKLAISRAHSDWCWWNFTHQRFGPVEWGRTGPRPRIVGATFFQLPSVTFIRPRNSNTAHRASVPPIPPGLRPKANLERFHILWEAEWQPVPPHDPILLRHIAGPLFAVLAQWELTEVERAVLQQRFV